MRTVNAFVGRPIERLEDFRFVRGRGQYVDDLARNDMLHAAILRSSIAHGRIRTIDVSRAKKVSGVHAVITAADLGDPIPLVPMRLQPMPEFEAFGQPVMARDKVRYVGEALAMVLADSAAIAEDALGAIEVDIEPLPAIANWQSAAKAETLLFENKGSNVTMKFRAVLGDADAAFTWIDRAIEERTPRLLQLGVSPAYDQIRGDPRFAERLSRVGLTRC